MNARYMKFLLSKFFAVVLLSTCTLNAYAWNLLPGAGRDVADGWVLGISNVGGGYEIFRWNDNGWEKMPGGAVRIGGTYLSPWVVNDAGNIFRWTGNSWQLMPGAARDVGDGWVIGTDTRPGGYGIFRWNEQKKKWIRTPGGAVRIGGTYQTPWVVNNANQIFRWTGKAWQLMPGAAVDVADGWVLGTATSSGGREIFRWNGSGWTQVQGGAIYIGGSGGTPWVVNNGTSIFRW